MRKSNKLRILLIILFLFLSCSFFAVKKSYAIYRTNLNTKVRLSILDPSSTVAITLVTHGANETYDPITKAPGQAVGVLPTPTKTNYNFLGWWTTEDDTGTKVDPDDILIANVTYHAHWAKLVCKKALAGTLHNTEVCKQGAGSGCRVFNELDDPLIYGTIPGSSGFSPGDAYNCDVNDDGTYDASTERFYFLREIDDDNNDTIALVHYTSFDAAGQMDSGKTRGSYAYDTAITYLPSATTWSNDGLITFANNKPTRLLRLADLEAACETNTFAHPADFEKCQFLFETSRYQSESLGRAGIWLEYDGSAYRRIQTKTVALMIMDEKSENSARPVIEIPYTSIEGYKERVVYNITLDLQGGEINNSLDSITFTRYEDQTVGTLPTPTRDGFRFLGWFDENDVEVTSDTIVTGQLDLYAHWEEVIDTMQYVFRIPGACTFNGSSTSITSASNNCISTINPTGSEIDYTDSSYTKKYIDTLVALYDSTNHDLDYEIGFTIDSYTSSGQADKATLMNTKAEISTSDIKYPGVVFRRNNTTDDFLLQSRKLLGANAEYTVASSTVTSVVVARRDNEIWYSINGGEEVKLNDLASYNPVFDLTAWFGAAPSNAAGTGAQRFFKGTLSNMYVKLEVDQTVTHNVTFVGGTGATVSPFSSKTVTHGSAVGELPTATKTGFAFDGWWTQASGGSQITTSTQIGSDKEFYAHWKDIYYITFHPVGGTLSIAPNDTMEAVDGETLTSPLPTATKTGYVFDGWYTAETGGTKITGNEVITADGDYYARWKEIYQVTFHPVGGTLSIDPDDTIDVVDGGTIEELPTATKTGYAFDGWYTAETGGTKITGNEVITADDDYYAHWKEIYQITFHPVGGTLSIDPDDTIDVVDGGTIEELPTATKTGYAFDGWYTAETSGTKITGNEVITADDDYYAHYKELFDVTFVLHGGTINPSDYDNPLQVADGDTIDELPTANKEGGVFDGWYTAETGGIKITGDEVITGDVTYHAIYKESATVTFSPGENVNDATIEPFDTKTVGIGALVGPIPTATRPGYTFDGWFTDTTWTTAVDPDGTIITGDVTFVAKWTFSDYEAMIGSTKYEHFADAFTTTAVPKDGVKRTIVVLKNIETTSKIDIVSGQNIELDLQNFTLSNDTTAIFGNSGTLSIKNGTIINRGEEKNSANAGIINNSGGVLNISGGTFNSTTTNIFVNRGTINITGGRLESTAPSACINNNSGGVLTMSGGQIVQTSTVKGQCIYNDGGTTTISGNSYLENYSNTATSGTTGGRAALHNNAGTVYIESGTIVSKRNAAVKNNGTMYIGIDDGLYDNATPVMQGYNNGLETVSGKTVNIYGGIFKGRDTSSTGTKAISNESYITYDTTAANLVHSFENVTIGNVTEQYDTAYLESTSVTSFTVTFNTNGGSIVGNDPNTKTVMDGMAVGTLPKAEKTDTQFLGWFASTSGGEKLLSTTVIDDDVTYYARYTTSMTVCRPATTLHSVSGTNFGQIHSGSKLEAGDAYDCDVNGDGTFDATNERFYYLTDSGSNAVFIHSNNTSQVSNNVSSICGADAIAYGADYAHGPTTAMGELPTTSQWSNVSLYTEPRDIKNNAGTSVISDYVYEGKAARFATVDEIKAATTTSLNGTTNELASYTFLLENTPSYTSGCRSNYWLETPSSSGGAYRIDGKIANKFLGHNDGNSGVRPVIEVPYSVIQGAVQLVEFDIMSPAMRTYFDNISTWAAGQTDSDHSSYDTAMTNNLNSNHCVYFENDNRDTEVNYSSGYNVYCDQPNQFDTGVTGNVNVYEYNESTGTTTAASYVTANNGKLYNFIPNKLYYWESASDSSINGYVRAVGERRIISIDNTTPATQPKYKMRNVRDLGGIKVDTNGDGTIDGTIKYGKLFRSEKIWGDENATVPYLTKLGINHELDLRGNGEPVTSNEDNSLPKITSDPNNASNVVYEIIHYGIDYTNNKANYDLARGAAAKTMYEFVNAHNNGDDTYSLIFHCRIGADRTGTLAYILEGLLGAPTEERYRDYELTVFFGLRERTRFYYNKGSNTTKFQYLKAAIRNAGDGVNEDVMTWFLKGGNSETIIDQSTGESVTVNLPQLISDFRSIMIDSY